MKMNLKLRLKAALKSFINPSTTQKPKIQKPAPEPSVVIDNQLLAGKNVLITGAGRNIGRNIALEMAKQGANIFFTDLEQERCSNLEQELNNYPVSSRGFISNVSKIEDIDVLYNLLIQNEIKIDILVNNAGLHPKAKPLENFDLKESYHVFDTNVFGPMYLTKLIANNMISNNIHGSIIFITSIHQWSIIRSLGYSASKAALGMVVKELALDLSRYQIRVNGIAPGYVIEDEQGNPYDHEYTPLYNTSINPRYIGRAAVYLASDYFSRCTTGTVLKVDAGLSLHNHIVEQIQFQ